MFENKNAKYRNNEARENRKIASKQRKKIARKSRLNMGINSAILSASASSSIECTAI